MSVFGPAANRTVTQSWMDTDETGTRFIKAELGNCAVNVSDRCMRDGRTVVHTCRGRTSPFVGWGQSERGISLASRGLSERQHAGKEPAAETEEGGRGDEGKEAAGQRLAVHTRETEKHHNQDSQSVCVCVRGWGWDVCEKHSIAN